MRRRLRKFEQAVDNIKQFVEPDTTAEITRRLISGLQDQIHVMATHNENMDAKMDSIMRMMKE
jgi:hypothetical protein